MVYTRIHADVLRLFTGMPVAQMRLIYMNKQMDDSKTLNEDYDISDNSQIVLVTGAIGLPSLL